MSRAVVSRRLAASVGLFPLLLAAAPVAAAELRFIGTGTVSQVTGAAPTSGSVGVGDSIAFDFTFDPAAAVLVFNGGTGFQAYTFAPASLQARIGSYNFVVGPTPSPAILLGRNFAIVPPSFVSQSVFNQAFSFAGLVGPNLPFTTNGAVSTGLRFESIFPEAPGAVPTLNDLRSTSGALSSRFSLTVNGQSGLIGVVAGNFTGTLSAISVPEPASWVLLILGFGAIGGAMRSRSGVTTLRVA